MKAITDSAPEKSIAIDEVDDFRRLMKKVRLISIVTSLGSIAVFGGLGWLLDLILDKKNFCTIIGLVIGFVVMNITSVVFSKRMVDRERAGVSKK